MRHYLTFTVTSIEEAAHIMAQHWDDFHKSEPELQLEFIRADGQGGFRAQALCSSTTLWPNPVIDGKLKEYAGRFDGETAIVRGCMLWKLYDADDGMTEKAYRALRTAWQRAKRCQMRWGQPPLPHA